MLVLTRMPGERIIVRLEDGREVILAVMELGRGRVRLGVIAPDTIGIFREEIAHRGRGQVTRGR